MAGERTNIEIGIGAGGAKRGATAIRRALDSIQRKSKTVHASGARDARKHGRALGLISKALVGISGFIIARSLIKSTIDFGQAVSDLSAITGAVGKDLDFLREKSLEFGRTTTLTATQAAEAFKVIASAKPDLLENVEALSLVTEEAIALAEATGVDLPAAANTLGASLNQFGAGADQASRFINVLAAGSKRGAALVGEMGEALKFAGVIAAQAGLSFETTNAALQLMSTFAIKGGEAGTQLRGVLLALSSQSNAEFNPEIVGLTAALDNLAEANLSSGEAVKLFGRRNKAAAAILIENRERLGELTDQLTDTTVAYEQQAIRVDNLSGDIKALKSAYEGLELTIGSDLNSAMRAFTQSVTENIRALSASPLLKRATIATLDAIHRIVEDLKLSWAEWADVISGSTTDLKLWKQVGTDALLAVAFLWDQFTIGGPANLKVAVILMMSAWDLFTATLIEQLSFITTRMKVNWTRFVEDFKALIGVAGPVIVGTFVSMRHAIARVFDNLKVDIATALDTIVNNVANKIQSVADAVRSVSKVQADLIQGVSDAIRSLAGNAAIAREELKKNEDARRDAIQTIIDEIRAIEESRDIAIAAAEDTAAAEIREATKVALAKKIFALESIVLAGKERDATFARIEALRTERQLIIDGAAAAASADTSSISATADEGAAAYESLGDIQKEIVDGMSEGLSTMASKGKIDFTALAASIIENLIKIQLQTLLTQVFTSLIGGFAPTPGPGAGLQVGAAGAAGGTFVPQGNFASAAHGGSFKVGGSGGTDSQLALLKVSPNEIINVRTPQQVREKESTESGRPVKVTFVVNNNSQSEVSAVQSAAPDGSVLIEATISAVSQDIGRNGQVFQAIQGRNRLTRR